MIDYVHLMDVLYKKGEVYFVFDGIRFFLVLPHNMNDSSIFLGTADDRRGKWVHDVDYETGETTAPLNNADDLMKLCKDIVIEGIIK